MVGGQHVEPPPSQSSSPFLRSTSVARRAKIDAIATARNQLIVTVRNHLMELLPWLVAILLSRETPLTFRYRTSIMRVMPLRWLGLFLDSTNHITTVTTALRLTAELVPLYGPNLVGPGGEKSLAKVRPLGHRMPTFHYLSDDAEHVSAVSEQLTLLFHLMFGTRPPPQTDPPARFSYDVDALCVLAGPTPVCRYPDFFHVILRIITRTFTAPREAPSADFCVTARSGRRSLITPRTFTRLSSFPRRARQPWRPPSNSSRSCAPCAQRLRSTSRRTGSAC
jgi:hypothetical protein